MTPADDRDTSGDRAWDAELELGFEALDHDHRHQARALAALEGAVRRGGDPQVIESLLLGLIQSTHEHFDHEQQLMQRCSYPLYDAHAHSHERLMGELRSLREDHAAGRLVVDEATLGRLRRWLGDHIKAMDHALAEYLKEREPVRPT